MASYKYVASADFDFSIRGVQGSLVEIQVDFFAVAKVPIDLKAAGGVGAGFHEYGADAGQELSPPANPPEPTKDLPPGITEVYQP